MDYFHSFLKFTLLNLDFKPVSLKECQNGSFGILIGSLFNVDLYLRNFLILKNVITMKTIKVLILTVLIIAISGCKYKKESERLQTENQNLTIQLQKSDSTQKVYQSIIDNVLIRLDSVLTANEIIKQMTPGQDLRTNLNKTVSAVNNLIEENKQKYQSLRNSYYARNTKVKELEGENEKLNLLLGTKDSTINSLNKNIAELNSNIDDQKSKLSDLSNTNRLQKDTIKMMTDRIHTAYYISGDEKDLRDKNIITKTGGCLGIFGRVDILNPGLNSSSLEKIDVREQTTFTINTDLKNMEFITPHPVGTYEITNVSPGSVEIKVTNPAKFWEFSNYLVIAI